MIDAKITDTMPTAPMCVPANMTLRDYFAGIALHGMLTHRLCPTGLDENELARECYVTADAMMKARDES